MRNFKEEAVPTKDIHIDEVRRAQKHTPQHTFYAGGTHIACLLERIDQLQARNEALERQCRELSHPEG